MILRVGIVDDEPIARRRVRRLLRELPGVHVTFEAGDGGQAIARAAATPVDLVLLDVEMPEGDGFDVSARLPAPRPLVVFLTAFDRYAVQAFDVHAVDYLLKPVSRERLREAMGRVRERLLSRRPADGEAVARAAEAIRRPPPWLERLPVRINGRVHLIDVATIDWIAAADNYVTIHCGPRSHLVRETLGGLEAALDPGRFVRVHRSAIVRLAAVVHLESALRGDYTLRLRDGAAVPLSRTHRVQFEARLGRRIP